MLINLFTPLPMKVAAGIIAALVILLAIAIARADAISVDREDLRTRLAATEASHAVTKASLAALDQDLARMVNEGAVREQRVREALEDQRQRSVVLREEAGKIIARGVTDPCKTPEAVLQLKGL